MSKAEALRHFYETNIACGDVGEAAEARMLAEIAAAEAQDETKAKARRRDSRMPSPDRRPA